MKSELIFLDLREDPPRRLSSLPGPAVLCLGNFDGVHRAHTALLREGVALASRLGASCAGEAVSSPVLCGVFCFMRPSWDHTDGEFISPTHLTTLRERLSALRAAGAEVAVLCHFPAVRELSVEAFMTLLQERCACAATVCGCNFRFGRHAVGTPQDLVRHFGANHTVVLPLLELDGIPVSSSRIRSALQEGDCETANRLLGRPYALEGMVRRGKGLGHTWGLPTANQAFPLERLIPARGVYAVLCHTPDGIFPGVANVGCHPTVDARAPVNCETYILGYSGDLYGKTIRVEFCKFLRGEQAFPGIEALIAAIRRDAEAASAYLAQWPGIPEEHPVPGQTRI